jgi:hypothetical protein
MGLPCAKLSCENRSSKHQVPSTKETPSLKLQKKLHDRRARLCDLIIAICLGFEASHMVIAKQGVVFIPDFLIRLPY